MTVFVTADTHFSHAGICKFLNADGSKLRPWDDPNVMDEEMVKRWNEVVKPTDKVYHLGDVVINRKALVILNRLNGNKVLIRGNHDIFKLKDYIPYFRDIRGYHVLDRMIFSHIPIHPDSKGKFVANVHGHLHSRKLDDLWYQCVCVEHTNYRPIELGEIQKRVNGAKV